MTALETIPFHGDNLLVAEIDGVPHIVLRPAFEAIGLDADRQIMNMKAQVWATTSVTAVVAADGKTRDMVTADLRSFLMQLATPDTHRGRRDRRPEDARGRSEHRRRPRATHLRDRPSARDVRRVPARPSRVGSGWACLARRDV